LLKLTLDGKSMDTESLHGQTLAELIRSIEQDLTPERVIVSMTLDGQYLDQESEKADAGKAIESLSSLEINTQRVDDLASSTLRNLVDFIPRIAAALADCVEELQSGRDSVGYNHLNQAIEGLQIVSSAWPPIIRWLNAEGWPSDTLLPRTGGFKELLNDISCAQENGDTVQLCDYLESELAGFLEDWRDHALKLLDMLEQGH
jgi:hypothetical protein